MTIATVISAIFYCTDTLLKGIDMSLTGRQTPSNSFSSCRINLRLHWNNSTGSKASFNCTGQKKRTTLSFSVDFYSHPSQIISFLHFTFLFYIHISFIQRFVRLASLPSTSFPPSCTFLAYSRHRRDMLSCLLSRGRKINCVIILTSCDTAGLQGFPATTLAIYQLLCQAGMYRASPWLEFNVAVFNFGVNSESGRGFDSRLCQNNRTLPPTPAIYVTIIIHMERSKVSTNIAFH